MLTRIVPMLALSALAGCGVPRHFDYENSATSLDNSGALQTSDPIRFSQEWLGAKAQRVEPHEGAAVEFQVTVSPPARPGYRSVGGKETDDAIAVFNDWCSAQHGKSVAQAQQDPMGLGVNRKCLSGAALIAAFGTSKEADSASEPVRLSIVLWTPESIHKAGEKAQMALQAAEDERRHQQSVASALQRELDAALRAQLKVGSRVAWISTDGRRINGLVIDLRPPLAQVQFDGISSTRWVQLDELGQPR